MRKVGFETNGFGQFPWQQKLVCCVWVRARACPNRGRPDASRGGSAFTSFPSVLFKLVQNLNFNSIRGTIVSEK